MRKFRFAKRSSPYKRRRYARKTKTIRKNTKVATVGYVKKLIHSNIENKVYNAWDINRTIATAQSGVVAPTSVYLLPQLSQGTGAGQRIGNEVKLVSGYVRGYVNLLPYNAITNPFCHQHVRIMVLSVKDQNNSTPPTFTDLFEGNSSSNGCQANMLDMLFDINKTAYTLHYSKVIQLSASSQSSNTNGTAGQFFDNKPFSAKFSFNLIKKCYGKLRFNDAISSVPENKNMFLVFQSVSSDGSSSVLHQPAEFHYQAQWKYEDA